MLDQMAVATVAAIVQACLAGLMVWGISKALRRHRASRQRTPRVVLAVAVLLGTVALSAFAVWALEQ